MRYNLLIQIHTFPTRVMARTNSPAILGMLALGAVAAANSLGLSAQLSGAGSIDWKTASCYEKTQAFTAFATSERVADMEWVYDGVLDDLFGPGCTFAGPLQPVGYISEADIIIDPNVMEGLYFAPQGGFYLVTYQPKKTVAYVFRLPEGTEPYSYIGARGAEFMSAVNAGRAFHQQNSAEPPASEPSPPQEPAPQPTPTPPPAIEDDSDLFKQIQEMSEQEAKKEVPQMVFYRDGKVVRKSTSDDLTGSEVLPDGEEDPATDPLGGSTGEDPLLEQLLKEQEEFLELVEEAGGELPEGEEILEEEAEGEATEETTEEEAEKPAAPEQKQGLGMMTILTGVGAVVIGVVFALFMLLKKKKGVKVEEAPTPTAVSDAPMQKSNRLEQALAAMDDNSAKDA